MTEKNKLKAVVVDDDANSRKLLNILLSKFPEVKVVGEAGCIRSALNIIKKKKPNSVFLDICLRNESGFDLMKELSKDAKIVLVSAYDDYAIKAFEFDALDYLKKPIDRERLALTISRLLKNSNGNVHDKNNNIDNDDFENEEFSNNTNLNKMLEYDDRLFITVDGISRFIKICEIQCITAEKDYSYIYLVGGKKLLVLKPMVEWEERLTPKFFIRIHRSTIVNLEYVEKVEKWFNSSYHVYLQNIKNPFQMSRRYASKLKEKFK